MRSKGFILIPVLVILFLSSAIIVMVNYLNIVPISGKIPFLSFLPSKIDTSLEADKQVEHFSLVTESRKIASIGGYETAFSKRLSFNGETLIYPVKQGDSYFMVTNGKEGKKYLFIGDWTVSPDGKRVVYEAGSTPGISLVVENEVEGKSYEGISRLIFSSDSKKLAYVAHEENKSLVVVNGEEQKRYDGISTIPGDAWDLSTGIYFSPNSQRLAYIAKETDKEFVVVDGNEQGRYDEVEHHLIFSADSRHLAYLAQNGDEKFIVIDGKENKVPEDTRTNSLSYSKDGSKFGYMVYDYPKRTAIVNGELIKLKDEDKVYGPYFSPDGEKVIFSAEGGGLAVTTGSYLVINGKFTPEYKEINSFVFSDKGHGFAYIATTKDDLVQLIVDDQVKVFDQFKKAYGLILNSDGQYAFIGVKKDGNESIVVNGEERNTLAKDQIKERADAAAGKLEYLSVNSDFTNINYSALIDNDLWLMVEKVKD